MRVIYSFYEKIELLEREGDIRIERDIRGSSEAGDGPSGAETGGLRMVDPVGLEPTTRRL